MVVVVEEAHRRRAMAAVVAAAVVDRDDRHLTRMTDASSVAREDTTRTIARVAAVDDRALEVAAAVAADAGGMYTSIESVTFIIKFYLLV